MSEDYAYLPALINEVREVCGLGPALMFAHDFGGTDIWVPKPENLTDDHELVQSMGKVPAQKFCELYAGEYVTVPLGRFLEPTKKQKILEAAEDKTLTHKLIARRCGTTERWVRWVLSEAEPSTPSLFD